VNLIDCIMFAFRRKVAWETMLPQSSLKMH